MSTRIHTPCTVNFIIHALNVFIVYDTYRKGVQCDHTGGCPYTLHVSSYDRTVTCVRSLYIIVSTVCYSIICVCIVYCTHVVYIRKGVTG